PPATPRSPPTPLSPPPAPPPPTSPPSPYTTLFRSGPQQAEDLAAAHDEVDAPHRLEVTVGLAQSADLDRQVLLGHGGIMTHTAVDRKSTRLNSSHLVIAYAVFWLEKKMGCGGEVGS